MLAFAVCLTGGHFGAPGPLGSVHPGWPSRWQRQGCRRAGKRTSLREIPRPQTDALDDPACLWETEDLLARVGAEAPGLLDCGLFAGGQPLDNVCFVDGLAAGNAVQVTINNCIDCLIHSTYVSTPSAGKFHFYREADLYGDALREVRVESCADFVAGVGAGANCAEPVELYSCSDALPEPSDL